MFFTLPVLIILIGFAVILAIRQVLTYRKIRFGRMLVTPLVTLVSCAMAAYGISRGADAAGWLILAGLGFSVAADSVLMVVEVNLMDVGLSFFLITHILYLAAFALLTRELLLRGKKRREEAAADLAEAEIEEKDEVK